MIEEQFPQFYMKADEHAGRWQARYLRSEQAQLLSLLVAANVAAFSNLSPIVIVVLFAFATGAHLYRLVMKADERWWNGRAGAESAKTLCWKYVVGGSPFAVARTDASAELADRLSEIAVQVAKLVPVSVSQGHVTTEMNAARSKSLTERIELYQEERIRNQMHWYARRSDLNGSRSRSWSVAAITAQIIALTFGVVGAANDWNFDFVGAFSAAAASAVAWIAVRQYDVLARSYAVTSNELSAVDVKISSTSWSEDRWSAFVNEAEEAISREHTSWQASRAV